MKRFARSSPLRSIEVVDESLLDDARRDGLDGQVVAKIGARLSELADAGATSVVCTCSTIAGVAESLGTELGLVVSRVDRAMVERAVSTAALRRGKVAVVAALDSTMDPTADFIAEVASTRGVKIEVSRHLVDGAWLLFESGETHRYHSLIADELGALDVDVIVLAQASMAGAAELADVIPEVVSSPVLAVAAAIATL